MLTKPLHFLELFQQILWILMKKELSKPKQCHIYHCSQSNSTFNI